MGVSSPWLLTKGQVEQEIPEVLPHSEHAHFKKQLYNPQDDQGLEHSEGRYFAQISHTSIGGFQVYLEWYHGHNHWQWWYYAQVGEAIAMWTHSLFVTNLSSEEMTSTKYAAIQLCRVQNLRV